MQFWQIGFNGTSIQMAHGHVDGAINVDETLITAKSTRDLTAQALQEARHRFKKKRLDGYNELGSAEIEHTKAMKFNKYVSSFSYEQLGELREYLTQHPMTVPERNAFIAQIPVTQKAKNLKWPVYVCRKLDGIRQSIYLGEENGQVKAIKRTRANKPIYSMDHLDKDLLDFLLYLPHGSVLDGELFTTKMNYDLMGGIIRRSVNQHPRSVEIEYHIFDIIVPHVDPMPYEQRYALITNQYNKYVAEHPDPSSIMLRIVACTLVNNDYELLQQHYVYTDEGYEGTMLRKIHQYQEEVNGQIVTRTAANLKETLHNFGRTDNGQKFKEQEDAEGIVVKLGKGKGKEAEAAIAYIKPCKGNGPVFKARPCGSIEMREEWIRNPDWIIGKKVTYEFQGLGAKGKPRFPRLKRVHADN